MVDSVSDHPLAPTRFRGRQGSSSKNKIWSEVEDAQLFNLVSAHISNNSNGSPINWFHIASFFPNKTQSQVSDRWLKVLDPSLLKGSWTRQEDETIISFVNQYGQKYWSKLANMLPGRLGKQVRERWVNHLDPSINRSPFTEEEDRKIIELHQRFGNHWTKISSFLPQRSDNAIKNRWYSTLSKRLDVNQNASKSSKIQSVPTPLSPLLETMENQDNFSMNKLNYPINSQSKRLAPFTLPNQVSIIQLTSLPQMQSPNLTISPNKIEPFTPTFNSQFQNFSNISQYLCPNTVSPSFASPVYLSPFDAKQGISTSISVLKQSKCDKPKAASKQQNVKSPFMISELLNEKIESGIPITKHVNLNK